MSSGLLLSRLTKLEAENVALQEEILILKKQLTTVSLSPPHPRSFGSPQPDAAQIEVLQSTIADLRHQVEQAVVELAKYRKSSLPVKGSLESQEFDLAQFLK